MTQNIDQTLAERGERYGDFEGHATVTQAIKEAMQVGDNWAALPDDMKECLEMVAHKIGRILNGDPDYIDSWTDIIGYTRLVEKRLTAEQSPKEPVVVPEGNTISGLVAFLAHLNAQATELSGVPKEEERTDPTCVEHNPELAKAIEVLRRAGVLIES